LTSSPVAQRIIESEKSSRISHIERGMKKGGADRD
jgi:hypothetical protein